LKKINKIDKALAKLIKLEPKRILQRYL
jgi:hypothetical protein